jgi:hypothetical protein
LGKVTVGKSGSGFSWVGTVDGAGKPARSKAAVTTAEPTPWSAVCTMETSRGLSGATTRETVSR